jgi:hypothetical protein
VGGQLVSEWDEANDEAWFAAQREKVVDYLQRQGLHHGAVAERPAWHISPHVALWPIGSLIAQESIGWWVISGDLPTDYCSSKYCPRPRDAARHFSETWRDAVRDPREDGTLGSTGLPMDLKDLLGSRAKTLAGLVADDEIWLIADDGWV